MIPNNSYDMRMCEIRLITFIRELDYLPVLGIYWPATLPAHETAEFISKDVAS